MEYILSTLTTVLLFGILIVLLAAKPKVSRFITSATFAFAGICGLLIYGYGYSVVTDNFLLAILQAVRAVIGSFIGRNEYSSISAAPFMKTDWAQILCALAQICALYATASAVITSIGAQALKRLRLWLGRRANLNLIYGIHDNALSFGKELAAKKKGVVAFVAPKASPAAMTAISNMGCVLLSEAAALKADKAFLRRLGFGKGKRKLTLYALDEDSNKNISYATALLNGLNELQIPAERTGLVLMGQEEAAVSQLQHTPEKYGYGFVTVVNEAQMAARLLTMKYPPCNQISFDAEGRAAEDFRALVIGFGQVGQAVVKSMVMNGQFAGSRFRLDVFARNIREADGSFASRFGSLLEQNDIRFYDSDARSRPMYAYLKENGAALRYIVISTGSEKTNREIAEELLAFLRDTGSKTPVYQCTRSGVAAYNGDGTLGAVHPIYSTGLLCSHTLDQRAMLLNHKYQSQSGKTPLQNWMACDYFSRQSCRAAADFVPAFLRAAGKSEESVAKGDWSLSEKQLESLSETEHLRWCAFHYAMGFSPMDDQEYAERAKEYLRQKEETGKPTIRIGKNMAGRTHACLIPWAGLDALSAKETAITGKAVDYKAMDTDNILSVPSLLQAPEE